MREERMVEGKKREERKEQKRNALDGCARYRPRCTDEKTEKRERPRVETSVETSSGDDDVVAMAKVEGGGGAKRREENGKVNAEE